MRSGVASRLVLGETWEVGVSVRLTSMSLIQRGAGEGKRSYYIHDVVPNTYRYMIPTIIVELDLVQ